MDVQGTRVGVYRAYRVSVQATRLARFNCQGL